MHLCYCKALRDGKRLITAYWLNDCLLLRRMSVPWSALHFPYVFGKEQPCSSQVAFLVVCRFYCLVICVQNNVICLIFVFHCCLVSQNLSDSSLLRTFAISQFLVHSSWSEIYIF